MKWKKKGGDWRCGEGSICMCVEPVEGKFLLKWRDGSGAWDRGALYDDPMRARERGEELLAAMLQLEEAKRDLVAQRKKICAERQAEKDAMTPREKTLVRVFKQYVNMSYMERAFVLHMRPDLKDVFNEFDSAIEEMKQESELKKEASADG